ncbi:hypothetical protein BB558_007372 [Smittium angustum]|uniref:Vta1/callose synthase N-terminal domain-containing protein n=1 Tax=Smittium angustum TaxID=133377 RepID=A0A2U1IV75_SMIAN|nr:hypothetical protein BB558_007372 [Smittium angustum]
MESLPSELKSIAPYIQRSTETEKVDPIVSYYCLYHSVKTGLQIGGNSVESQTYISGLLDKLEQTKSELNENQLLVSSDVDHNHLKNFSLKIFVKADNEDRAGTANIMTARNYVISTQFMEVLSVFKELDNDIVQKIKYAKWRASEIIKANREGRPYTLPEPSNEDTKNNTVDESGQKNINDNTEKPFKQVNPDILNTQNQLINLDIRDDEVEKSTINQSPPNNLSNTFSPNVLSPTTLNTQSNNISNAPSQHTVLPTSPSVSQNIPGKHVVQPVQSVHQQVNSNQGFNSQPNNTSNFVDSSRATNSQYIDSDVKAIVPLDFNITKNAQKHAKWAISALEYDDVNTAIKNLQISIDILKPYMK